MKKQTVCVAIGLLCLLSVHGQSLSSTKVENPISSSLGILIGTAGGGLEFYQPLGDQFGIQAGFSLMPFDTQIIGTYGQHETRSRIRAQLHNVHILFDWAPFYKASSFFRHLIINAGGGYFMQAKGYIHTTLKENYYYGDIKVPYYLIGEVDTHIDWKESVAPYLGLALTDIWIDSRFGFDFGLGGYYLSAPAVRLTGTKLLQYNQANGPIIERNIRNYRFLPQLQLGVNYRFKLKY